MHRANTFAGIFLTLLLVLVFWGCGGGGGGDDSNKGPVASVGVTVTGTVDDGAPNSPIRNARCRFERQGEDPLPVFADANGVFRFDVEPGIQGFFICRPPALLKLTLSTFLSTEGLVAGNVLTKNVTPTSSLVAELLKPVSEAMRSGREQELLASLVAGEPNLTLLTAATTSLYAGLFTAQVNVDFVESESAEGGADDGGDSGDSGGAEGDASDGAEASPIPGAVCDFALSVDGDTLVRSVLGDLFDNGVLDRPDLQAVVSQVPIADPTALANAFRTMFPGGISRPLSVSAEQADDPTPGRYHLRMPPDVPGFVRCVPPEQQQLRIATFVPRRQPNETLSSQDVTPPTTLFSSRLVDPLDPQAAETKQVFLDDLTGLRVGVVQQNGVPTGVEIVASEAVEDKELGLVAFAATALFNSLLQNQINVEYLPALDDVIAEKGVDPASLGMRGVSAEQSNTVAVSVNNSVAKAADKLGTTLEVAVQTARLQVTVLNAANGLGIPNVVVTLSGDSGGVQCDNCPVTTDDAGAAHLLLSHVPATTTVVTVAVNAASFGTASTTTEVFALATATATVEISSGNLEVVARVGTQLYHFFRGDTPETLAWTDAGPIVTQEGVVADAAGDPVLIQSTFGVQGNFDLVYPALGGGIVHLYRDNDAMVNGVRVDNPPWFETGPPFGVDRGDVAGLSLIQSNYTTRALAAACAVREDSERCAHVTRQGFR